MGRKREGGGGWRRSALCAVQFCVVVFFELLGLDMDNFVVYNVSLVHLHNGETCSPMVKGKREESEFV